MAQEKMTRTAMPTRSLKVTESVTRTSSLTVMRTASMKRLPMATE